MNYFGGLDTAERATTVILEDTGRVKLRTYVAYGPEPHTLAFELKTGRKGDGVGHNKCAIGHAISQLFVGCAGLLEALGNEPGLVLSVGQPITVTPMVVTTARVFSVVTDISTGLISPR